MPRGAIRFAGDGLIQCFSGRGNECRLLFEPPLEGVVKKNIVSAECEREAEQEPMRWGLEDRVPETRCLGPSW